MAYIFPLVLLLFLSGCALPLASGGNGDKGGTIEALRQDCEMKRGRVREGVYVDIECFDPARWMRR